MSDEFKCPDCNYTKSVEEELCGCSCCGKDVCGECVSDMDGIFVCESCFF